jgi:tetratricopeptide (TPR) repeat protein
MPHADPERSLEVAARHLFRHIRDAAELRRNPLVRAYFETAPPSRNAVRALSAVHARVMEEARAASARQQRIVGALCAGERADRTAAALGISRRHYYRERQEVCRSVALALARPEEPRRASAEVSDPLGLLLGRAAALSDQGFAQKGVGLLDRAWSGIAPGAPRALAQLALVDALIAAGEFARAERVYRSAAAATGASQDDGSALRDRAALVGSRLAIATGNDASGGPALAMLAERNIATGRTDPVTLETLIECGLWQCANARFEDARRMLRRAREIDRSLAQVAPHQRVALALLEAYCVEDDADVSGGSQRRFRDALALSTASASMRGTLEATTGLMGYHASIGNDETMYDLALSALDIARSMEGRRQLLFAAAWIGTTLMKTRYWRALNPLLFDVERFSPPGTLYWTFVKEAQGDFLARSGRYDEARASFAAAQAAARKLDNRKWQSIVLRDVGIMLGRLGQTQESAASLRRAVDLAERGAGAWSLSLTYRAASKVLADDAIARRARVAAVCGGSSLPGRPVAAGARRLPLLLDPRGERASL